MQCSRCKGERTISVTLGKPGQDRRLPYNEIEWGPEFTSPCGRCNGTGIDPKQRWREPDKDKTDIYLHTHEYEGVIYMRRATVIDIVNLLEVHHDDS